MRLCRVIWGVAHFDAIEWIERIESGEIEIEVNV